MSSTATVLKRPNAAQLAPTTQGSLPIALCYRRGEGENASQSLFSSTVLSHYGAIVELRRKGYLYKQIRGELSDVVSEGSISNVLKSAGMSAPRINGSAPLLVRLARSYGRDGIPAEVRESNFGVSQQTVSRVLLNNGVRRFDREKAEKRNARICRQVSKLKQHTDKVKTKEEIARRNGVSLPQLYLILAKERERIATTRPVADRNLAFAALRYA